MGCAVFTKEWEGSLVSTWCFSKKKTRQIGVLKNSWQFVKVWLSLYQSMMKLWIRGTLLKTQQPN